MVLLRYQSCRISSLLSSDQMEKSVCASTHTIDLNEVALTYPPRSREKRTRHVGAATTATGVDPGIDLAQAAGIRVGSPWCAKRLPSTLANRVEHALFA